MGKRMQVRMMLPGAHSPTWVDVELSDQQSEPWDPDLYKEDLPPDYAPASAASTALAQQEPAARGDIVATKKHDSEYLITPETHADREAMAAYEAAADAAMAATRPRDRNGRFVKRGVIATVTGR